MLYHNIINKTKVYVKKYMDNLKDISHDYNHIELVVNLTLKIAKKEGIYNKRDLFHIIMGALLHDVGDSKYSNIEQSMLIKNYLQQFKSLNYYDKSEIIRLASNVSLSKEIYVNNNVNKNKRLLKLHIIQDADRINSLGAIGIMRYISYNIINNKKPSFDEIINNMNKRTLKIKKFLKTKTGIQIANKNFKLITDFSKNYSNFLTSLK